MKKNNISVAEIISDSVFEELKWKPVSGAELNEMLTGLTVVCAEPVNYPDTTEIIIYFENSKGNRLALAVGGSTDDGEKFHIEKARINKK